MTLTDRAALPRVSFESAPPPLDESLPRMDVAAFVGFAASGPMHVPVAVEDVERFRDVFGPDPVLARTEHGSPHHAHLGGAVEAFFRNGGTRAWVVRVGDAGAAVTNTFAIPGLLIPPIDGASPMPWQLASVRARSPGSWSDDLRAAAVLSVTAAPALDVVTDSDGTERVLLDLSTDIVRGDLLRIDVGAGGSAWVVADAVAEGPEGLLVSWSDEWRVTVFAGGVDPGAAAALMGRPDETVVVAEGPGDGTLVLDSAGSPGDVLVVGAADLTPQDPSSVPTGHAFFVLGDELPAEDASLPEATRRFSIAESVVVTSSGPSLDASPSDDAAVVEVMRAGLLAWRGEHLAARIDGLGFHQDHPRYIGSLPHDGELFALAGGFPRYRGVDVSDAADLAGAELTSVEQEALAPRFPFAGYSDSQPVLLPLTLGFSTDPALAGPPPPEAHPTAAEADGVSAPSPPDAEPLTPLERDGLAAFGAGLFLDPDLAPLGSRSLLTGAFHKAYVGNPARPLQGIHAVIPLEEVTLLAVPDAVHPGWTERVVPPPIVLTAPALDEPVVDGELCHLTWTEIQDATSYEVEFARDAEFSTGASCRAAFATELQLDDWPYCPAAYYFRVRASRDLDRGPWSNVVTAHLPADQFVPCENDGDETPLPSAGQPAAAGSEYRAWVLLDTAAEDEPLDLLAVHTAMIRLGAARADLLSLLALPADYRGVDASRYVTRLTGREDEFDPAGEPLTRTSLAAGVLALDSGETAALSYAALYHPWIVTGEPEGETLLRHLPPDGPMAGVYAEHARSSGAWIAPANQPIAGALSLDPPLESGDRGRLVARAVNTFARDPRGFFAISQKTLSVEPALRPVNVRRLMILLRRLVQRAGTTYVFQPNDAQFRRLVQMRFERLLADMYRRGAFAGSTPEQAYQIATGPSVNPPGSVDLGRFVVEIRVAPSQPMKFVVVRLVMTDSLELAEV